MATNLNLDDDLINEAVKLGHHASKRDAVNAALREYIAHRKRMETAAVFGTIDFDPSFDYKQARRPRRSA